MKFGPFFFLPLKIKNTTQRRQQGSVPPAAHICERTSEFIYMEKQGKEMADSCGSS